MSSTDRAGGHAAGPSAAAAPLVYYVTAHGYGHGVRSCEILNALHRRDPHRPVTVVSGLPGAFFRQRLDSDFWTLRQRSLDVGLVQHDGIRADLPSTLEALGELNRRAGVLTDEETAFLAAHNAAVVVADIPGIPFAASRAAGIPSVAVGNFSWDWIYDALAASDRRWTRHADLFRKQYQCADLLVELPFSGGMDAFRRRERVGLTASPGVNRRDAIAAATGVDPDLPWVLLAFTALSCPPDARRRLCSAPGHAFFTVEPLRWADGPCSLRAEDWRFNDLVASMDVIVSKPGYGIVSECAVNAKPLIHVERRDFIEAEILEAGIDRALRHVQVSEASFYRGDLAPALEALATRPEPLEHLPLGGADSAAAHIQDLCAKHR